MKSTSGIVFYSDSERTKKKRFQPFIQSIALLLLFAIVLLFCFPHTASAQAQAGSLWGMGSNGVGQLGDGTTEDRHIPVMIESGGIVDIETPHLTSFYIKSDGSLWGMGSNGGQLGDGTTENKHAPIMIESSGVVDVATDYHTILYIKFDGSLWGTGWNEIWTTRRWDY